MRFAILFIIFFGVPVICLSKTIYVPGNYPTIQQAIDASVNGDTVLVAPGTYKETFDYKQKAITVKSSNGPFETVIDGNNLGKVVCIYASGAMLEGFTITNGIGSIVSLGGYPTSPIVIKSNIFTRNVGKCIDISGLGNVEIINNIIIDNYAISIECTGMPAFIHKNIIINNSATDGTGLSLSFCKPTISNNIIANNYASHYGGGINCIEVASPTILNNTIIGNKAEWAGGGIHADYHSHLTVINTILWNNESPDGPEAWIGNGGPVSSLSISYSNVKGGQSSVKCYGTLNWGPGMVNADPLFTPGPKGFLYLGQIAAGQLVDSPCVDTGSNLASNLGMDIYWTRTDSVSDSGIVDMGFHYGSNFIFPTLQTDTFMIPENTGGDAAFLLLTGTGNANRNYILLGSITGTDPGTPLPGGKVTLPLNFDIFTNMVINLANTPPFSNFIGKLDSSGSANAVFNTFGPIPGAAGITMNFAFALNSPWDFASNPVEIEIVP